MERSVAPAETLCRGPRRSPHSVSAGAVGRTRRPAQQAAAAGTARGLAKFDGGRGWTDLELASTCPGLARPSSTRAGRNGCPTGVSVVSKRARPRANRFSDGTTASCRPTLRSSHRGVGGRRSPFRPCMIIVVKRSAPPIMRCARSPRSARLVARESALAGLASRAFDVSYRVHRSTRLPPPGSSFSRSSTKPRSKTAYSSLDIVDRPLRLAGRRPATNASSMRPRYSGPKTIAGRRAVAPLMTIRAARDVIARSPPPPAPRRLRLRPLSVVRLGPAHHGAQSDNAYAILAITGSRSARRCRCRSGPRGKVISAPTTAATDGKLQRRRLVRQGNAAAAAAHPQLLYPMARPDGPILPGVSSAVRHRVRDLYRPLSARRHDSGPTNVWFIAARRGRRRRLYRYIAAPEGHGAQGGASPRRSSTIRQDAFHGSQGSVLSPAGIRWVPSTGPAPPRVRAFRRGKTPKSRSSGKPSSRRPAAALVPPRRALCVEEDERILPP